MELPSLSGKHHQQSVAADITGGSRWNFYRYLESIIRKALRQTSLADRDGTSIAIWKASSAKRCGRYHWRIAMELPSLSGKHHPQIVAADITGGPRWNFHRYLESVIRKTLRKKSLLVELPSLSGKRHPQNLAEEIPSGSRWKFHRYVESVI